MSSTRLNPHGRFPLLALGAALVFATACSPSGVLDPARATDPSAAQLAKGGKGGGGGGGSDAHLMGTIVAAADHFVTAEAIPLASTCATGVKVGQWHLDFGSPSDCLVVTLTWNEASGFGPYDLTDDVKLVVQKESGKNGQITHVRLLGQDIGGAEGVGHNTDWIPVAEPVVPNKAGFTLHVHAAKVPVYRLDSHLFDGNQVTLIGWVSIGDAVYSVQ